MSVRSRSNCWKCWILRGGEDRSAWRKSCRSKGENQQQTQRRHGVDARIWTLATLVGGECCHHYAIPCSPKSPFLLRDSRVSKTRARLKITPREKGETWHLSRLGWLSRALAFRLLYDPWAKMGTTRSLPRIRIIKNKNNHYSPAFIHLIFW